MPPVSIDLPKMPGPAAGALGRPIWNELGARAEQRTLRQSDLWLDAEKLQGGGRPVVLVTGYAAPASSMSTLGDWLTRGGYHVHVANMQNNRRSSSWAAHCITAALQAAADSTGEPAALIGHSRGGQQCRVVTTRRPELVAQLVTLGAPVRHHLPRQIFLRASIEALRLAARSGVGPDGDVAADRRYVAELESSYEVATPWTSIWSRRDGVVEWQACVDRAATNVEVGCSHLGLTGSVGAYEALADALVVHPS